MISVCMISSLHGLYDDRIYWKEAVSLKNAGYEVYHISTGDRALDFISENGIRLIQIRKKRYFSNPYLDILFRMLTLRKDVYKQMFRVCAGLRADVYHYHDIQVNRIAMKLKNLPHAPKLIYDVHEDFGDLFISRYSKTGPLLWIAKLYRRWLDRWEYSHAQHCDFVIVAVEHIYNKFTRLMKENRTEIIFNYTTLSGDGDISSGNKKYDAIYCGQINRSRGAMQIARAVSLCRDTFPSVCVLLIGPVTDTRLKIQLQEYIEKNNLQNNLIMHEQVPYSEISSFYRESKIGLGIFMPVSIFYYGIQIKTFEYMAFGLPVICSNFGTIGRIVLETGTGITVNPLSPYEISKAIVQLLTNREQYDLCSRNGINAVRNTFNWKSEEKKLLRIYKSLIGNDKEIQV